MSEDTKNIVEEIIQKKTNIKIGNKDLEDHISMKSPIYMVVFFVLVLIILACMIAQYVVTRMAMSQTSLIITSITGETIVDLSQVEVRLPYNILIYTLSIYALIIGGVDTGRSVAKTRKNHGEGSIPIPKYKRRRIMIMMITYVILAAISCWFQIVALNLQNANFFVGEFFAGIAVTVSLLAAGANIPKLTNDLVKKSIGIDLSNKNDQTTP